ncbi:steryl-sulfatase isoform X2 [Lingula anatina]|nr:steryl-sulfatase isoform X2 [Lingula anatina]|eukprot:XP_023932747.1 steryl-sulfatase isoform X2 [Lingula anatina]
MNLYILVPALLLANTNAATTPNIVIFLADDTGIGDIGCFGNTTLRTPNIDNIAARGLKMTQHLTSEATCTPSRASLLTSRYPIRSGLASPTGMPIITNVASPAGLPPNETTFANLLQDKGYVNAFIGKWHLGLNCEKNGDHCHHPNRFGFDLFYGMVMTNARLFDPGWDYEVVFRVRPNRVQQVAIVYVVGLLAGAVLKRLGAIGSRGFRLYAFLVTLLPIYTFLLLINWPWLNGVWHRNGDVVEQPINFQNMTKRLVMEGTDFLEERSQDKKPFLLFMSWLQTHTFLHTAKEFEGVAQHSPYGDNVEEMDWGIGEIMKALDRLNLSDNTLIYFTSDNGGHIEEKDRLGNRAGGHNGIYRGSKFQGSMDGGIRVPTAFMWPGHIPEGTVTDEPTSQMDILPTLADVVGYSVPKDRAIDGKNIWPLITGRAKMSPHEVMFHYCGMTIQAARYRPRGEENAVYKLYYARPNWNPGTEGCDFMCSCLDVTWLDRPQLFNVAIDPSEKSPLDINAKKHVEIIKHINKAKTEHEKNRNEPKPQMEFFKAAFRPWLQPLCSGDHFQLSCSDPKYGANTSWPEVVWPPKS